MDDRIRNLVIRKRREGHAGIMLVGLLTTLLIAVAAVGAQERNLF